MAFISETLKRVEKWQRLIARGVNRAEIARRDGLTRARVTQLTVLNHLPDELKRSLRSPETEVASHTLRGLICHAKALR